MVSRGWRWGQAHGHTHQLVLLPGDVGDVHVVGGGRQILKLFASEDIDGDDVDLGVTVLASLRGGHLDDLAGTALNDDVTVLPQGRALHGVGGRRAGIGRLEGNVVLYMVSISDISSREVPDREGLRGVPRKRGERKMRGFQAPQPASGPLKDAGDGFKGISEARTCSSDMIDGRAGIRREREPRKKMVKDGEGKEEEISRPEKGFVVGGLPLGPNLA